MEVTDIEVAFLDKAIKFAGLPMGEENIIKPKTLNKLAKQSQRSHAKFLRQIMICANIKAPLYWWTEFDTYKIGVTRMSTSVMHTILKKGLSWDDFEPVYRNNEVIKKAILDIKFYIAEPTISDLHKVNYIKAMLPSCFLYTSFVTFNYEVLRNMYHDRKNHRLYEWKRFLKEFETIKYFREFIQ